MTGCLRRDTTAMAGQPVRAAGIPCRRDPLRGTALLERLERQAERIGQVDPELVSTRAQLSDARMQLLALQAPKDDGPESLHNAILCRTSMSRPKTSSDARNGRPWWRF